MNVRKLKVIIGFVSCAVFGFTTGFAAEVGEKKELEDNLMALLELQESMKKEKAGIDGRISNNISQQTGYERKIQGSRENEQMRIAIEISRLEAEDQRLELQRQDIVKRLEDMTHRIDDIVKKIQDIVTQESKPKDMELDAIVTKHKEGVPWDGKLLDIALDPVTEKEKVTYKDIARVPKIFAGGRARVIQLGALGQARGLSEQTNYCGYFAVYNTTCLAKGPERLQERLLNRAAFAAMFEGMLKTIKSKRGHGPYDNLAEDEIELLLQSQGISERQYVFITQPRLSGPCEYTELTRIIQQSGHMPAAYAIVAAFKVARTNDLFIIFNVGGTHAHWVAIHAQRIAGGVIQFVVVDSLNLVAWTDEQIIAERLGPLYRFITSV